MEFKNATNLQIIVEIVKNNRMKIDDFFKTQKLKFLNL